MTRKFRRDRLYKIVRGAVVFITVISLLLGVLQALNIDNNSKMLLDESETCTEIYSGDEMLDARMDCRIRYYDRIDTYNYATYRLLAIGILLPALFFGSGKLINYLFPKER